MSKGFDYLSAYDYIKSLINPAERLNVEGKVIDGHYVQPAIGPVGGVFLEVMVKTLRPQKILEIGTSAGYSTMIMGHAARSYGGKVISVEIHERIAAAARENMEHAGLNDTVEIIAADGAEYILHTSHCFDMIFQDGDKKKYSSMLDGLCSILKTGGMLISDDILFPLMNWDGRGKIVQEYVEEYNRLLSRREDLKTVWLPFEDGLALSVKL